MTPCSSHLSRLCLTLLLIALGGCAHAARPGCNGDIPAIFDRVSPAVVMISAQSINPYRVQGRVTRIIGSGFIYDAKGLVITNSHVAFGRQTLYVTLDDGNVVPARLLGADPIYDIAVLQISKASKGKLATVPLGDSEQVRVGESVIAIGNPLGLDQTVTRGIISGVNRVLPETPMSLSEPLIQTDTPINPGNSGGPLLNLCGEVIGMNTAIVPDAQSIGFAIPINLVKSVLPTLIKEGHLIRPWLGFQGSVIGPDVRKVLKLPLTDGLLIEVIEPGSPAESVGLRGGEIEFTLGTLSLLLGGDIITRINGVATNDAAGIAPIMRALKVGDTLSMSVFREGQTREVSYTLPERPLLPGDLPEEQFGQPPMVYPRRDKP
jgi:S1-C subfamily serine protease